MDKGMNEWMKEKEKSKHIIWRQNGYGLLRCYIMLSSRQTPTFWRNPLPPHCNRTELTEKKTACNKGRETYRPGATLPFFIFFFPHSLLLVLLLSILTKNKLFRVMIQMTCSQPPFSQLPILTVMYKLPPCSHEKKQDSTRRLFAPLTYI